LQLIWRFLKAPVIERGKRNKVTTGIPQGGALSPTLANIYLHKFDQYWYAKWGQQNQSTRRTLRCKGQSSCVLFRYADDFILCIKGTWNGAVNIRDNIIAYFPEQLKLNLTADKTRVVPLEKGFDFLGFHIQRQRLGRFRRVLIRPTHRNVARLVVKLQKMLGQEANADDPAMKINALNRVLMGWANYYKAVNARKQFEFGDYVAKRLFQAWYRRRHNLSIRESWKQTRNGSQTFLTRNKQTIILYQMTSLTSQHTSMIHKACWKYRSIRNPYLQSSYQTCLEDEPQPLVDVQEIYPTSKQYDEIYLVNRLRAFDRDGWKCTQCSKRTKLVAHHIEPVPVGNLFDPEVVHRVENLETLCATCHRKLRKPHSA
jgi:RNA-directed DNA polymerase